MYYAPTCLKSPASDKTLKSLKRSIIFDKESGEIALTDEYEFYTIGWELSPLTTDVSNINGISYWVYNAYDQPIQDWVRRTIREASGDDSKDELWNYLQPGWNQRIITKDQLIEMGFKLDEFKIFTLMFSVPTQYECELYIDEIMFY